MAEAGVANKKKWRADVKSPRKRTGKTLPRTHQSRS